MHRDVGARVRTTLAALGGIAPARDLMRAGITPSELRTAVLDHAVLRFRKGWYTLFELPDPVVHASRVGGVLSCVSAARLHGLWTPDDSQLHVAVPVHTSRLRSPGDHHIPLAGSQIPTVVHWTSGWRAPYEQLVSIGEAIHTIAACRGAAAAFVVLESALRKQRLPPAELKLLLSRVSAPTRELLEAAGPLSDSGGESYLALLLRAAGIPFQQQVFVAGVGWADFRIGERLLIEADSKAHHADPTRDRHRDAEASVRGHRTLRFMYSQIVYEPDLVLRAILAAIERGDHRA